MDKETLIEGGLNPYAAEMYVRMESVAREKYTGYTVHLIDRFPPMSDITVPCIIGSMVLTSKETQQRWMLKHDAIAFAGTWVTSADIARLYLNEKYKKTKRRITTLQWKDFYETYRSMPLVASPAQFENAYYIDVRSAYWTILRAVGWDVDYMPGQWLKVKDRLTVNDFPFANVKMARNCLVSLAADGSRMMKVWDGGKLSFRRGGNGLVNKMLWAFVTDCLNNVAYECAQAGAVYSFTDGFIVPESQVGEVENVIASWGLSSSIKHNGPCEIKGAGAYKFPDIATRKFTKQGVRSIHKIHPVFPEWMKARFKHFSDRNRALEPFDHAIYESHLNRKLR